MKALRYYGARDVRYESMDDPAPQSEGDAVVRVTACSICGSDLHIYHGHGFSEDMGFCVGHEAVGEVVEVGSAVQRHKVGDLVMLPAAAARVLRAWFTPVNSMPAAATASPPACKARRPKPCACLRQT